MCNRSEIWVADSAIGSASAMPSDAYCFLKFGEGNPDMRLHSKMPADPFRVPM